ncbi:MAG: DUF1232 domain-containing protein [Coleofasciculaceae cyanobacterium SM2_1_6]|nr:DUF1232 domain-containing protein [Coleofasciculaceae cyanobacterium SM2_1_6]
MAFSMQSVYNWYRNIIRNPKYRWWVILGTIVYVLSPFDISPDFIPVVGQIDDVLLMTLLVSEVSQVIVESVKRRQGKVANDGVDSPVTNPDETVEVNAVSID